MTASDAERQHTVTTADGMRLQAWLATPPPTAGGAAAALLLCHGMTTNAEEHGAFPALRDLALRSGLAVGRFDFRAHGRSTGTNEQLRLAGLRSDVDAVLALMDEHFGADLPVIPLGLSFGGGAAIHAAATKRRCAGLALWYAIVDYAWNYGVDSPVPFTSEMRAAKSTEDPPWSAMPIVAGYHFPHGMIDELEDDPTLARLSGLKVPVLAFHGTRDRFVDPEPLRRVASSHPNVKLRMVPGAGHGFFIWRPWVIRRTVSWAVRVAHAAR